MSEPSTDRLRVALQKKGRLADSSYDLLRRCGLRFSVRGGELLARVKNMPVDLLLLRDDDIPSFVASGAADIGIVGQNVLVEEELTATEDLGLQTLIELSFSRCKLSLAAPGGGPQTVGALAGTRIATTYPGLLRRYLDDQGIDARIVEMKGAVELAPSIGIADAICDLVSSGATLAANKLTPFADILHSEAVLVASSRVLSPSKADVLAKLLARMDGVLKSSETKYVMLNAPRDALERIIDLMPGTDSPSVVPLADRDDMVAVQAVCHEAIVWEHLEDLKALGARAILVLPIEKMMA